MEGLSRSLELCWVLGHRKISGEQGFETVALPGSYLQSSSLPSVPGSSVIPRAIAFPALGLSIFLENSTGQCYNSLPPALA